MCTLYMLYVLEVVEAELKKKKNVCFAGVKKKEEKGRVLMLFRYLKALGCACFWVISNEVPT